MLRLFTIGIWLVFSAEDLMNYDGVITVNVCK